MKIKYFLLISLMLGFGCTESSVDFTPINQITTQEILSSSLLGDVTQGNYAFFKNFSDWRNYMNNRNFAKELMSDDIIMMRWSGNNFSYTLSYNPQAESTINLLMWQMSYRAISSVNVILSELDKVADLTEAEKQLA